MSEREKDLNSWPGARDADGFLTDPADIIGWLAAAGVPREVPRLRSDGVVDSWHDVDLSHKGLARLPVRFGEVAGSFLINNNNLTLLAGAPNQVGGRFLCNHNQLISLLGGPWRVDGYYNCEHNQLMDLYGCACDLGSDLYAGHNHLESLRGIPHNCYGDVGLEDNRLTGFEGSPATISGSLNVSNNPLDLSILRVPAVKGRIVLFVDLFTEDEVTELVEQGLGRRIGSEGDDAGEIVVQGVQASAVLEKIVLKRNADRSALRAPGRPL